VVLLIDLIKEFVVVDGQIQMWKLVDGELSSFDQRWRERVAMLFRITDCVQ